MQMKKTKTANPNPHSMKIDLSMPPPTGSHGFGFFRPIMVLGATSALLLCGTLGHAQEEDITYQGPFPAIAGEAPATARAAVASGKRFDINAVVVTGDRIPVYSLDNWESYENNALYEPMSEADIEAYRQRLLKDLQDQGYLFATVNVYRPSLKLGFLKLRVHVGQKGEVTVIGNRWTSAEQVLESVEWETGGAFNYRSLYQDLFSLNLRPRVDVETNLKPRVNADGQRVVDIEFDVKDRFPLHMAWSMSNSGTQETSDWRSRLTAQLINLLKRDEIFTLEWFTDPINLSSVVAISGSYYMPLGEKWGITGFAGFSRSELDEIIPALDITGKGSYYGLQLNRKLKDTEAYSMDLSFGWVFQESQNINQLSDGVVIADRTVQLSMPRITIGYAAKQYDKFAGRNVINNTLMFSLGEQLGSTGDGDASAQNPGAEGTVFIDRFSFARFQKLFRPESKFGQWSLFTRLEVQATNDSVPSALYKSVGGHDSVRGYRERAQVGDYGISSTVELRTPLFENFLPRLKRDPEYLKENPNDWAMHRAQFVMFYDYGWVAYHQPLPGQDDDTTIASFGLGMRMGLTKYSQLRFDYGFQLQNIAETDEAGRAHFSVQLQY